MRRRLALFLLAIVMALVLAVPAFAAGPAKTARTASPNVNVFAAASLTYAFPAIVPAFKKAHPKYRNVRFHFNFQGTDTLVAQIQQGAPADVFAGASTKYGNVLFSGGLINTPQNFCQNKLIVITPKKNPAHLHSLAGLATPGVMISIGDATVPIGAYTRTVLGNLNTHYGSTYKTRVLANVVSDELTVSYVVALVKLDEVDAGFVYVSDAHSAGSSVTRLSIPNTYQSNPLPTYPIATTKSSTHPAIARSFVKFVLGKSGQKILKMYSFLPKPAKAS
jgi:molybdate transport system substrate-binding protein